MIASKQLVLHGLALTDLRVLMASILSLILEIGKAEKLFHISNSNFYNVYTMVSLCIRRYIVFLLLLAFSFGLFFDCSLLQCRLTLMQISLRPQMQERLEHLVHQRIQLLKYLGG